jgi:hypothetical protein
MRMTFQNLALLPLSGKSSLPLHILCVKYASNGDAVQYNCVMVAMMMITTTTIMMLMMVAAAEAAAAAAADDDDDDDDDDEF